MDSERHDKDLKVNFILQKYSAQTHQKSITRIALQVVENWTTLPHILVTQEWERMLVANPRE